MASASHDLVIESVGDTELSMRSWPALARAHIAVRGTLDGDGGRLLSRAVVAALQPRMVIALDLADVTQLGEPAIRAILECRRRAQALGAEVVVQDPSPVA